MKPIIPFTLLTFGVGFGSAWYLKPAQDSESTAISEVNHIQRQTKSNRPDATVKSLFDRLLNNDPKNELLNSLKPDDIPALMEEFKKLCGFSGLRYQDKEKLKAILCLWYQSSPQAALTWASSLQNTRDRRALLEILINEQLKSGLDSALVLVKQYREPDGHYIFPVNYELHSDFAAQVSQKDEAYLLKFCRDFISNNDCVSFLGTYPKNYNFKYVLDHLAEIQKNFKEGESFSALPSNLLSQWAMRDPDAAWQWLQEGKKVSNCAYTDFFEDYARSVAPVEFGRFLAEHFIPGETSYQEAFQILTTSGEASLESFLISFPERREELVDKLFIETLDTHSPSGALIQQNLVKQMQPGQLQATLIKLRQDHQLEDYQISNLKQQLPKIGMSKEEISALVNAVKK